jgi:proteasome lid subunit RPN8/RPN11
VWVRSYRKLASLSDADRMSFTRSDPIYWIISSPDKAVFCRNFGGRPARFG